MESWSGAVMEWWKPRLMECWKYKPVDCPEQSWSAWDDFLSFQRYVSCSLRDSISPLLRFLLLYYHFILSAHFLQAHSDTFRQRRRHVLPHKIRFDRQLAMPAINQHRKL